MFYLVFFCVLYISLPCDFFQKIFNAMDFILEYSIDQILNLFFENVLIKRQKSNHVII
jgi:hypothetical protein